MDLQTVPNPKGVPFMINLHFLGGAMEIGGSCIYIKIGGKHILLDSGIRQSASKDPLPDFRTIQEQGGLDAIIVSHAHMDHTGTLPLISKAYPQARIYMTAMTADLTRVLLYDSLKIMNSKEDEIPHYSEQDVLAMLNRIYPVGYQTPFPIFEQFTLTFYPAGHIAGAACTYLVTPDGSLFYSGDFSAFSQRTIEGIRIPKLRPDAAIVESTYGTRLHANRLVEERRLVDLVRTCVNEQKKILIPAFALGRAQEVLLILRAAIQNQEIPAVPIYVDGMVRDINRMYTRNPTYLKHTLAKRILKGNEPFYTKEIQPVAPMQNRDDLLTGKGPLILLSSSGMLTGGPSAQYAARLAPMENACIIITGYQDEESPGRQLLNLLTEPDLNGQTRTLTLNGVTVPVKCRVEQVGLSAHGDKSEIMALLDRLSSRRVFLVHGSREVIAELGTELTAQDYRRQVYLPECGQDYEILLRSRRKQLSFQPAHTMQMKRTFGKDDEKLLWEYWQEHYLGKSFSIAQITYIWYGHEPEELSQEIAAMQELFLHSAYFSPNAHRLFLFEANTPKQVAEALAPKEQTIQELEAYVRTLFPDCGCRKISFHKDRKEILLQFDYPDSQDPADFAKKAAEFAAKTDWTIRMHPSMNHQAASFLLSSLFRNRLVKTSYYTEKKCYAVTVKHTAAPSAEPILSDTEATKQFQKITGWTLLVNGSSAAPAPPVSSGQALPQPGSIFSPAHARTEQAEQNLAFYCIEETFRELPHKPNKKSLKSDSSGKYLELSFISPAIGQQYAETLQALANQTGWRIRIADKVNQMELFHIVQLLCQRYQIEMQKNPSYLPDKKALQIRTAGQEPEEARLAAADVFCKQTGCRLLFHKQ